jgi:hypothetical protein
MKEKREDKNLFKNERYHILFLKNVFLSKQKQN